MKMLKYLILFCAYALFGQIPTLQGQEINRVTILITDSTTKKPIIGALVSCKARQTYTMADKVGKVDLIATRTDSIYVEMQNYLSKKITIKDAENGRVQLVQKKAIASGFKQIKSIKKLTLNEFNIANVKHYVYFPDPFNPLPYQQVAQRLYNPAERYMLEKISVAQLLFDVKLAVSENNRLVFTYNYRDGDSPGGDNSRLYKYEDLQNTTFRVRVYRADAAGFPAEDLCNEEINITAENSEKIVANLSKYKIIIPKGDFFVAIQWLPNIDNASQIAYSTFSSTKLTGFKPYVGVEPIKGKDVTFFVKDYSGNWKISPDKVKLAIAITGSTE
ncbi:hypothetical protein H9N25_12935 [Pedobacter riviphilus]|uniref:Carboxypeptidase-like regulatory domain-containing protein n=1 Tax=Pedobacter riviphilus TaxID=2766984 RepID=A0ABX6TBN3_9SPHI|nr:hypothetical protein [Pedobacter riviphilus]QNR82893.1 hypothetical protein H9N25_12935 [Pedobacter riviphilus]